MRIRHLAATSIKSSYERFRFHQDVEKAINGGLGFGKAAPIQQNKPQTVDNYDGVLVNIESPGSANTAFSVTHNLGRVPIGFDTKRNNTSGVVYDSGTAWTTTTISLKCSTVSATLLLYIF